MKCLFLLSILMTSTSALASTNCADEGYGKISAVVAKLDECKLNYNKEAFEKLIKRMYSKNPVSSLYQMRLLDATSKVVEDISTVTATSKCIDDDFAINQIELGAMQAMMFCRY
jgi:hypothetical protein